MGILLIYTMKYGIHNGLWVEWDPPRKALLLTRKKKKGVGGVGGGVKCHQKPFQKS